MADEKEEESKGGGNMKVIIIAAVVAVIIAGGGVGAAFFLLGGEQAPAEGQVVEEPRGPAVYISLDPKFVVSFNDQQFARFMQFSVDIVTHNEKVKEQVDTHLPAIRSSLLMIFGEQSSQIVSTKEGKTQLLELIVSEVNATLANLEGDNAVEDGIEQAYFNSFIIQ